MGDKKSSFRERNHLRMGKKKLKIKNKVSSGFDVYSGGGNSKVLDFFIGFWIFFAFLLVLQILGFVLALIFCPMIYRKYFQGRYFVKRGMFTVGILYVTLLVFLTIIVLSFFF